MKTGITGRITAVFLALVMLFALAGPMTAYADEGGDGIVADTDSSVGLTEVGRVQLVYTEPVVLMPVSNCSASPSKAGYTVVSTGWYDSSNNQVTGTFGSSETHTIVITIYADPGFKIPANAVFVFNNSTDGITAEVSADSTQATARKSMQPAVWAPTVIKSPGGETVNKGDWTSFSSTASYCTGCYWSFRSPDGSRTVKVADSALLFPGMTWEGDATERLVLYNIPYELDGWNVLCTFTGPGGSVNSGSAPITVRGAAEAAAQVQPSEEAAAEEAPGYVADDGEEPEQETSDAPAEDTLGETAEHEHSFSDDMHYNDEYHWRECVCGEKTVPDEHEFEWTETKAPTRSSGGEREGVCRVCGCRAKETIPALGQDNKSFPTVKAAAFVLAAAVIAFAAIKLVAGAKKRKKATYGGKHSK